VDARGYRQKTRALLLFPGFILKLNSPCYPEKTCHVTTGGLYVALQNDGQQPAIVALTLHSQTFTGEVPQQSTRAWWFDPESNKTETLVF